MTATIWGAVALVGMIFGALFAALRQGAKAEAKAAEAEWAQARADTLTEVRDHEKAAAAQSDADLVDRLTRKP